MQQFLVELRQARERGEPFDSAFHYALATLARTGEVLFLGVNDAAAAWRAAYEGGGELR